VSERLLYVQKKKAAEVLRNKSIHEKTTLKWLSE
jgi:hypothetical protein